MEASVAAKRFALETQFDSFPLLALTRNHVGFLRSAFLCPPLTSNAVSEPLVHKRCHHGYQRNTKLSFASSKVEKFQVVQPKLHVNKKKCFKVLSSHNKGDFTLEARSMEEIYDSLVERLLPIADISTPSTSKYIVGLAGPPGAGKSTVANEVVKRLNRIWLQSSPRFDSFVEPSDIAIVIPMDGFHLYRSELDAMEDPDEAHARRGAPWTFNPAQLLSCLTTLRDEGSVYVPSFDHGVGDPVEDDIFVGPMHKIIIVEGNYLLLDDGIWKEISSIFDEKWFIDIDVSTSMHRVVKRHVATGKTPEIAKWRVEYNDRPNAELIMQSKRNADVVIHSVNFTH